MEGNITEIITIIGIVAGLALAYGRAFGSHQVEITQAVIDAAVESRFRQLLNRSVGFLTARAFTIVGVAWLGMWEIVPAGGLDGILTASKRAVSMMRMEPWLPSRSKSRRIFGRRTRLRSQGWQAWRLRGSCQ